jgi:hypothetical protein
MLEELNNGVSIYHSPSCSPSLQKDQIVFERNMMSYAPPSPDMVECVDQPKANHSVTTVHSFNVMHLLSTIIIVFPFFQSCTFSITVNEQAVCRQWMKWRHQLKEHTQNRVGKRILIQETH